ncbi:MAG: SusC/RagA family TonB-linked outer membrane protein [Bacteroidales bacterium]|nr:SusC/RagA family TonB-linked outer membrane protein [Bacteroidales bacterium]
MKRYLIYIIITLLAGAVSASAQDEAGLSQMDSISLENSFKLMARVSAGSDASLFDQSPEVDIAKALYGQFSGLWVKQGTGRSEENQSKLRLHGRSPLVLVDGFPRDLSDITATEIESITILKDAAAAALYGVKGANGVVSITTKRGKSTPLHVTAKYQYGQSTATRTPEFADSYTYALMVNQARALDGLEARYSALELDAFRKGTYPYAYPNVDWWSQIYRDHGDNHRAQFTFTGGNRNFKYFTAVDYLKDNALYVRPDSDDRYNANTYDNRLGIRSNVDVNITDYTAMKIGVMARLSEFNTPNWDTRLEKILYGLPSGVFPIKQADGSYGGSSLYGANNPVAILRESGQHQYSQTKVLANMTLRQDFSPLVAGLSADIAVAFDYIGKMTEVAEKEFRYSELNPAIAAGDGKQYLITNQKWYGVDSKVVDFDHWFNSLRMNFELQAKVNWERDFEDHHIDTHLAYRQRSWIENSRNASSKTQEMLLTASYNWKNKVFADVVMNYSGSAYLPKGNRFHFYPAVNVSGIVLDGDPYLKVYASAGLSGMDDDLTHELYRQVYGSTNGHSYRFGTEGVSTSGRAEGNMAALTLAPELSKKVTVGGELRLLGRRLGIDAELFAEDRQNIYISASNISGVLGISVNKQSQGENKYKGIDLGIDWGDKIGDFSYGVDANAAWLFTKVVDDGQAYQQYPYLYHAGNRVGQAYGLEVIGIFQSEYEINNSPHQSFGEVRPGDLKYRDQNGDGVIDSQDKVRMFGSTSLPLLQFGFSLKCQWKALKFFADFQGLTGYTVSLLDSPLYQPLVDNGTISKTFLSREVFWTPQTADIATMPRITTMENDNNYRDNSLWYRDGSFLKLRNIGISYEVPRSLLKICDATVSLNATNVFSLDNIGFADPEQLGAYYPTTRVVWAGVKFNF